MVGGDDDVEWSTKIAIISPHSLLQIVAQE